MTEPLTRCSFRPDYVGGCSTYRMNLSCRNNNELLLECSRKPVFIHSYRHLNIAFIKYSYITRLNDALPLDLAHEKWGLKSRTKQNKKEIQGQLRACKRENQ
jgi:hypothetical protein